MSTSSLAQIAAVLTKHQVEFIVIGGQAEVLFGSPRVTYDVDLCYRRSEVNLQRLADALRELRVELRGAPPGLPFTIDARSLALGSNFTLTTPIGDLDLLGWVEPLGDYDALIPHAEIYHSVDGDLVTISLDDLIRIKEHIGRPKDRESLLHLRAIRDLRRQSGSP
jgi:hypothetical protein